MKPMSILARLALLAITVLLTGWAWAEPPPFDYEKARQLSPEKRREYDVIFANELAIWGTNSNRYIDEYIATHREEEAKLIDGQHHRRRVGEFATMARDGYLPAYVALRLYRNGFQLVEDQNSIQMLLDAAEHGDVSAMCAEIRITRAFAERTGYLLAREGFVARGANAGHGGCLARRGTEMAWHRTTKSDGITPFSALADVDKALPDLYEAARQGYYFAHSQLFLIRWRQLEQRDTPVFGLRDIDRTLCWGRLAEQHSSNVSLNSYIGQLKTALRLGLTLEQVKAPLPLYVWPKVPAEYQLLLDRYDREKVPVTRKVATPERCLELEQLYIQIESKGA